MSLSRCYQLSNNLTCNSCHNVHVKERENIAVFSQRCINCHTNVHHTFEDNMKNGSGLIQSNCIDCHMPLKASKKISLLTKQKTVATPDFIRTHLITLYPEETKRFIDSVKLYTKKL